MVANDSGWATTASCGPPAPLHRRPLLCAAQRLSPPGGAAVPRSAHRDHPARTAGQLPLRSRGRDTALSLARLGVRRYQRAQHLQPARRAGAYVPGGGGGRGVPTRRRRRAGGDLPRRRGEPNGRAARVIGTRTRAGAAAPVRAAGAVCAGTATGHGRLPAIRRARAPGAGPARQAVLSGAIRPTPAPCGSPTKAMRPTVAISVGGMLTAPPAALTAATVASTSATWK